MKNKLATHTATLSRKATPRSSAAGEWSLRRRAGPACSSPDGKGSAFGGARGRSDVPKIVDWYMDGKLSIDPLITHRLKLEEINHGFELMERGESIRSVVVYGHRCSAVAL